METVVDNIMPKCTIKCLKNADNVSQSVHSLKHGMNTIGRGLNNDIVLKNLNVSRIHCHLLVKKKESKYIAYIIDLGTSNGTSVGNVNLITNEKHQLNNLDMITLANSDEGVVLQFIDQVDHSVSSSNDNQLNNKRKIPSVENLVDPTSVKVPKLMLNEPIICMESLSNIIQNVQTKSLINSSNITNELQHKDYQSISADGILKPVKDCLVLSNNEHKIDHINNAEPTCSHYNYNTLTSIKIKTEPNSIFNQGTYRNEEDSVIIVIDSSEEENDINENNSALPNIKIKEEQQSSNANVTINSTSNVEHNLNISKWTIQCQRDEIISDDEDYIVNVPSNNNENGVLKTSVDNDIDYNSKCPKIIDPLPIIIPNRTRGQAKLLSENENIIRTRAKSEKKINNKKETEEITINQNKKIMQERRMKLQQLANNKCTFSSTERKSSTNEDNIDQLSISVIGHKKTRISRLQTNNNCMPSTSKSNISSDTENQIVQRSSLKLNNSLCTQKNNLFIFAYYDTISIICKWNAVWLREEKFSTHPPPLIKPISKMKETFENVDEYFNIMKPLMLYEIWSKISESYNVIISKTPSLETCIFEKSLMKNIPLLSFDIQSVNKEFSTSEKILKSIHGPLWCLKCIETNKKNIGSLMGPKFSLKGYLCIVIIQSKCFETSAVKKPTKSKNIFFGYINITKKIGFHSNPQLYIELIITKKTANIPPGTTIHLMDIFYLHSELRLFQALTNVTTSSLRNALIVPQFHNFNINYSKLNLKSYNINSLILNNSQKEAVKMAITICLSNKPNLGIIIGPPGTGKTNVICNIVVTLMSKLQTKTKPKLLLCAPSNESVDALVKRIIEIKKDIKQELQFSVVRVGSGQKYDIHSPIADVMLDNLVKQRQHNPTESDNQPTTFSIFDNKKDIEKSILQNTDVIVTTLNSCFSANMEDTFMNSTTKALNIRQFTACIVDEAGQCIEPLNYVPLLHGIDKLILVGDDKQLQPVVKSKLAKDNGLSISLFKRLKTWFNYESSIQKQFPITLLDTQYRMHHEISLFPSTYFYKGAIKTASSIKTRTQLPIHPYIIFEHESQQDNSGEINIGEANMIVSLVEILLNSECNSLLIAVLTPYHKQREQINILLEKKKISLNVNTIDSFQGSECDILLISTVRTNGVGFMDDICRLNVALTRAKQSLIICGNFKSLKFEQVWSNLLEDARQRKLIKKVSKRVMNNSRALLAMIKL